jgi:hypothetical protein
MKRQVISVLCIIFMASSVFAQSLTTGHKYVTAIVDPGQGWVQVKLWPGKPLDGTLSYSKKSFVTFLVGETLFTNNDVGLTPFPENAKLLTDGVLKKIGDTVRCIWSNKNGVDLIQEVYPVLFEKSEQIVYSWKAVNKTDSVMSVSVQYLLDLQVGDMNYVNDGAPILTPFGYRPIWDQFTDTSKRGIPGFYFSFQYTLPNSPSFNLGISGQGYLDSSNVNLGLTKPWRQTIGDWNPLIQVGWGPPPSLPGGTYADAATLLEFKSAAASPGTETLIARTSYGTGEYESCNGQLFALFFPPHKELDNSFLRLPNPFDLELYVFDPQSISPAKPDTITLNVGDHLQIIAPDPITGGGKMQTQFLDSIPPLGVWKPKWTLQYDTTGTAGQDIISSLKFTASSPSLGHPIFVPDTCEHNITLVQQSTSDVKERDIPSMDVTIVPNPASEKVTIRFDLEKNKDMLLQMTDILGHIVKTERVMAASEGENEYQLDLRGISPGSYIVRAESGGSVVSHILKIVR